MFAPEGHLKSLHFDDPDLPYLEGTVLLGRIKTIHKSMKVAFVDIGEEVEGYLPLKTMENKGEGAHEGQVIMVRIVRSCMDEKGAKLSAKVMHEMPEGELEAPLVLKTPHNALQRALHDSGDTPVQVWVPDERSLAMVNDFVDSDKVRLLKEDDQMFERLEHYLSYIREGVFPLSNGGRVTVEHTKALTSVDVDTGKAGGGKDVQMETNLQAAREIARLCRLLDIGGSIVVDFVTMRSKSDREQIKTALSEAFTEIDDRRVNILNMSPFGLLEMNREKVDAPLYWKLNHPTYVAGEVLLEMWRQPVGIGSYNVEASPEVSRILKDRLTEKAALAYIGRKVTIKENKERSIESFALSQGAA